MMVGMMVWGHKSQYQNTAPQWRVQDEAFGSSRIGEVSSPQDPRAATLGLLRRQAPTHRLACHGTASATASAVSDPSPLGQRQPAPLYARRPE